MRKRIQKYLVIIACLVLLIFILQQINWLPSFGDIFKSKPVTIDESPILVERINELAQLGTITSFDEVVADSVIVDTKNMALKTISGLPLPFSPLYDRLVIIAKGKVVAGIDLKKLRPENIMIRKDSVSILLPPAEILDVVVNPSDIETFIEKGNWSPAAVTLVKIKARNKMLQRSLDQQILQKADARGKMLMENFLMAAGYKKVHFKS